MKRCLIVGLVVGAVSSGTAVAAPRFELVADDSAPGRTINADVRSALADDGDVAFAGAQSGSETLFVRGSGPLETIDVGAAGYSSVRSVEVGPCGHLPF